MTPKKAATQKPQQSDKGAAAQGETAMQPDRNTSRQMQESDTQQGQSEADRQQAVQQSEKRSGKN